MNPGTPGDAYSDSGWQVCSTKPKMEIGKVKFLPTEEVISLSSRTANMVSPRRNNPGLKYGLSSSIVPMFRKTSIPSKIVTPKFSVPREKTNTKVMSSGSVKPVTHGGAEISTTIGRYEVKTPKQSKEDCGGKQQPGGTIYMPAKEDKKLKARTKIIKAANINSEDTIFRASYASSPSDQTFHVVSEPDNVAVDERDLLNILTKLEPYRRYLPALEETWKGGFEFLDTALVGAFYGWFQARPPCRVRRKVLEFSKKLSSILQVKLFPRSHIWADLFGNDCPDFHDIALYFSPAANIERSKQNFSRLFELLEIQNSVMRSYIDGVELLIFTSKQLQCRLSE
ncbi:Zinc finger, FYVE/PHD-type [Melia azedarach]|uniref:Zinc finger, FYVE/PHD-type n=1 Tax=Melia azedarach TaxID=155640 RepID=A0ACC1XR24_MELAZ|nr:Zinc finger, FYVE/PHD-type [Melia azedarach]